MVGGGASDPEGRSLMGRCWCWHLGEKEHLESALQENDKGTPRADGQSPESLCLLKGTLGASFQGEGEGLDSSNRPDPEMSHITSAYVLLAGAQVQGYS